MRTPPPKRLPNNTIAMLPSTRPSARLEAASKRSHDEALDDVADVAPQQDARRPHQVDLGEAAAHGRRGLERVENLRNEELAWKEPDLIGDGAKALTACRGA
jgi:hypothetical protein